MSSSPAVSNDIVYTNSGGGFIGAPIFNGTVYALDATNGATIWSYYTGGGMSSPAVAHGVVYIGSDNNKFYALNAANGRLLWNYITSKGFGSSAAVDNGLVYVSSWNGQLYALNATDGTQLWTYSAGGGFQSSPIIVDGVLYISSDDGNLYAFTTNPPELSITPEAPEFPNDLMATILVISLTTALLIALVTKTVKIPLLKSKL
jgi:FOG: WD40-like repeat